VTVSSFMFFVAWLCALWVYIDAKKIGVSKGQVRGLADMGPAAWFWATLLLWIIAFPYYLTKRSAFQHANRVPVLYRCPHCNEQIEAAAARCGHCNRDVEPFPEDQQTVPRQGHVPVIKTIGIALAGIWALAILQGAIR
jgi:hypothetical protein